MKKYFQVITIAIFALLFITPAVTAQKNWGSFLIGLDPGHGGKDPGAAGPQRPHEGELALRCGLEIKKRVQALGGRIFLTRESDIYLSLSYRRNLSIAKDPYIFNSIHLNAFNGTARGTETWYYFSAGNSYSLAQKVQNSLKTEFSKQNGRNEGRGAYYFSNRGVKQNGWTVITGSSNIPAVLTEGLFVDNPIEWSIINQTNKPGFKAWVEGHLFAYYDHLSRFSSTLTNPRGNTPTPPPATPTLSVNPTSVDFGAVVCDELGRNSAITVSGSNLKSGITVTTSNSTNFTINKTSLPANGGTVIVTFKPTTPKKSYSGTITVKSGNLTKTIAVSGEGRALPLKLAEKWNISEAANNKESKGYNAGNFRNMTYANGKLYLVYNHSDIKVVNAQTGADLGNLNKAGVADGVLTLCDVKAFDGKIVACNLIDQNSKPSATLKIYVWDQDTQNPRLLLETANLGGAKRVGDCMELYGNWNNGVIAFANDDNTTTRIIEYPITNGTVGKTPKVTNATTKDGNRLNTMSSTRVYPDANGYWIDGKDSYLNRLDKNGQSQYYMDNDVRWGNAFSAFVYDGIQYGAILTFNVAESLADGQPDPKTTYKAGRMALVNAADGWSKVTNVGEYPAKGLGNVSRNTNATGEVITTTDGSTYVEAWVLSTTQGFAYYAFGNTPKYNPQPIPQLTNDPTVTADKATLTFNVDAWQEAAQTIKVAGTNLKGDISLKLSGADAQFFSISPTTIAKATASANVTVTYKPTEIGSHNATLTISSNGAKDVVVNMQGISNQPMEGDNFIKNMKQMWIYSQNENNLAAAPWFSPAEPLSRDMALNDGKLYIVNSKAWGGFGINIVDAYTGKQLGSLDVTGVAGGENKIASVKTIGGKIIACDGANPNHPLNVYIWDNDNAKPRLFMQDNTHNGIKAGRIMSVYGDLTNGKLMFSNGSTILVYTVTNNTANPTPQVINLTKDGTPYAVGDMSSIDVTLNADGTFWANGKDKYPTHFDANGEFIEAFGQAEIGGGKYASGSGARFFKFGDRQYLATITYLANTTTVTEGALSVYDMTDGIGAEGIAPQIYPSNGLGSTKNGQYTDAVCQEVKGYDVNIWFLVPFQGIAYYNYKGMKPSGIENAVEEKTTINVVPGAIQFNGAEATSINVYTVSGIRVAAVQNSNEVSTYNLAAGIYIVAVKDVNGNYQTEKVIIR